MSRSPERDQDVLVQSAGKSLRPSGKSHLKDVATGRAADAKESKLGLGVDGEFGNPLFF